MTFGDCAHESDSRSSPDMRALTSTPPGRASDVRRQATLAVTLLVLASLGMALVHDLLAQHAVCVEHGELVELGKGPATAARPDGTVSSDAAEVSAGGHEHCAMLAQRRGQAPLPAPAVIAVVPRSAFSSPEASRSEAPPQVALVRLAPKQSPPPLA